METPEEIQQNMIGMERVIAEDSVPYTVYRQIVDIFYGKMIDIQQSLNRYESNTEEYDRTVLLVQRQFSILGQEMNRLSTRNILVKP